MEKKTFSLEEAEARADELVALIKDLCINVEVCGSIRRRKQLVHDIDIVACENYGRWAIICERVELNTRITRKGIKIISGEYKGIPFDIYYANPATFETLKLIRTGSTLHNIKLCSKAKQLGWKLCADGTGLVDGHHVPIPEVKTERQMLEILLGRYVSPEERE